MNFQPKFDSHRPLDGPFLQDAKVGPEVEPAAAPAPQAELEPSATPAPPPRDDGATRSLTLRLSLIGFLAALASRATDPIIPPIAHDIQVDPNAVALLTTAFALPFALVQPVLGPVGDMVGKVRVMIACLAVTILAMLASGLATNFT